MAPKVPSSPKRILQARMAALESELRAVATDIKLAKRPNFRGDVPFGPVATLRGLRRNLRADLDEARLQYSELIAEDKEEFDAANLTTEEWIAHQADRASRMSIPELEPYVMRWAQQVGAMIVMEDGRAQLRYRESA